MIARGEARRGTAARCARQACAIAGAASRQPMVCQSDTGSAAAQRRACICACQRVHARTNGASQQRTL